jgi:hypothetical protein
MRERDDSFAKLSSSPYPLISLSSYHSESRSPSVPEKCLPGDRVYSDNEI